LVGAASTLATGSCDLADLLEDQGESLTGGGSDRLELVRQLRLLADKVETETADLRGHFLAMSADIEQYRSLTG
jgi:hypothetical protein